MNFCQLLKLELKRLLQAHVTWVFFIIVSLSPLLGYNVIQPIVNDTTAAKYLANPFFVGGISASFLFAVLALFTFHRTYKNQMESILYSVISPVKMHVIQVICLMILGFIWTVLVAIIYLPYTSKMLADCFSLKEYACYFFIYWGMTITLTLFPTAFFYNIWKRIDVSVICVALLLMLGLSSKAQSTWLSFVIYFPDLGFSSDFGNDSLYRIALYSRSLWICIFFGLWIISILGVRTHGKKWLGSIMHNIRKCYLIIPSILFIGYGILLYIKQPYIYFNNVDIEDTYYEEANNEDTSDEDMEQSGTWSSYEYVEDESDYTLSLTHTDIDLEFNCKKGIMSGNATYTLTNSQEDKQKCSLSIDPGFEIKEIFVNRKSEAFETVQNEDDLPGQNIMFTIPAETDLKVQVKYTYKPQIESTEIMYMASEITPEYITPSSVIPYFNDVQTESSEYACSVTLPDKMELIVGGLATQNEIKKENGQTIWNIEGYGIQPQIFAGDYVKLSVDNDYFPVNFYYGKKHQKQFEDIDIEQMLKDTICYCSTHYGILPYTKDYPLNIIVSNAHMMGGAAIENLSYMGETCFSADNLNDIEKGATSREVIAHEIIHQWWGISAPIIDEEDECWTAEAFACYATYRLMKDLYGDEYADKNYLSVWENNYQKTSNQFYVKNPQHYPLLSKYNQGKLDSEIIDTNLYSVGPLELKLAEQLVGGEDAMDAILQNLFEDCQSMELFYISKDDFIQAAGIDINNLNIKGVSIK